MKVLIAPLNWGLGHASRCVPLVERYLSAGDEVVLAGDGESLVLLRQHFPTLRYVELAPLNLRYSRGNSQVGAMLRAIPQILLFSLRDRFLLHRLLQAEHFDLVISDNRFGLFSSATRCVYITHQLQVLLPHRWSRWQAIATRVHARIYIRYNEVWVPDYEEPSRSLSGVLGHPSVLPQHVRYIGPLSRFASMSLSPDDTYDVVAVLSGLEPQRTLFEEDIVHRYAGTNEKILIVRGLVREPRLLLSHGNVTRVNHLDDKSLCQYMLGAKRIIARSGYSTIMDLEALHLLDRAELYATPGQPEQEYLVKMHQE